MNTKFLKICLLIILLLCGNTNLYSYNYQYQYFTEEKNEYVPFSDWIPKVRVFNKTHPRFVEDYYQLYGMKQFYDEGDLRKNIHFLKIALNSKFRHPSQALVKLESKDEDYKYRNLLFMHINILIMRNYMRIASKYEMQKIYYYHAPYAEDINKSLKIADQLYEQAKPYWQSAKEYAANASTIKLTTQLSYMESERYQIIHQELNYEKIINAHQERIAKQQDQLQALMQTNNRQAQ